MKKFLLAACLVGTLGSGSAFAADFISFGDWQYRTPLKMAVTVSEEEATALSMECDQGNWTLMVMGVGDIPQKTEDHIFRGMDVKLSFDEKSSQTITTDLHINAQRFAWGRLLSNDTTAKRLMAYNSVSVMLPMPNDMFVSQTFSLKGSTAALKKAMEEGGCK